MDLGLSKITIPNRLDPVRQPRPIHRKPGHPSQFAKMVEQRSQERSSQKNPFPQKQSREFDHQQRLDRDDRGPQDSSMARDEHEAHESQETPLNLEALALLLSPEAPITKDGLIESPLSSQPMMDEASQIAAIQDSPIISILTGQVAQVIPQDIPRVILGNNFIQSALQSPDIANFYTNPQPLSHLLENLEIPLTADQATMLQQNNPLMSPKELFASMGYDAQSIFSELTMMRDHLPIEGVTPYMVRSAALRAQGEHLPQDETGLETMMLPDLTKEQTVTSIIGQAQDSSNQPMTENALQSLAGKPFVASYTTQGQNPETLAQLENDWQGDSKLFQFEPTNQNNLTSHGGSLATSTPQGQALYESLSKTQILGQQIPAEAEIDGGDTGETGFQDFFQVQEVGSAEEGLSSGTGGGFDQQDERPPEDSEFEGSPLPTRIMTSDKPSQVNEAFTLQTETVNPTSSPSSEIRTALLEKAQMLLNSGGGAIRLELGTAELGQLDLAVQVQDKSLELKITASSDKAREMLSQELPALRQALLEQSLDLKTVEIGLSSEQQWSESFQDAEGRQQHLFYEEQSDEIIASPRPSINIPNNLRDVIRSQQTRTDGRIQIRV